MIFLFEGGVSGAGCFLKFESTWVVKDIRLCIPFTCTLNWNSILHNRLLRIHFELSCQHVWKETNMFTICILSWIKQIPGDNTQKRDSCAYSGCPSMSSSNTMFPLQSEAKDTTSLHRRLVVYLGQMYLLPTVTWMKLFIRFSTTISIQ